MSLNKPILKRQQRTTHSQKLLQTELQDIPLPKGFERIEVQKGSFAEWLRNVKLRKDNTVYLYNGKPN